MSAADPQPKPVVASWVSHVRATLTLGLPLIGAQLAQQAITVTDTVMLGWLSPEALAAGVLGSTFFFICFIAASGFAHGVMPLAAEAAGNGDVRSVRRSVRMGLWIVLGVVSCIMPLMWNSGSFLLLMGQEPRLAELAQDYLRIAQWALYPAVAIQVFRSFLAALERAQIVLWATVGGAILNGVLNWIFIFGNLGAPALGIKGAAIATLGTGVLTVGILILYVRVVAAVRSYQIFVRFHQPDREALSAVWRLGLPISGTLLAEVGLFAASSIMMGWLGVVALAAHGIALQVISILFMIPYGLSSAGTVRIGRALGRRDADGIERAGWTVLVMGTGFAVFGAVLIWVLPEPLIRLFLDDAEPKLAEIVAVGSVLLAVAAVFQIVDTLQVVSVGLLRGIKDTRVPLLIAVLGYWGLGIPSAYVLGITLGFGGAGVWGGLAVGLTFTAVFLTARFLRRERLGLVRLERS